MTGLKIQEEAWLAFEEWLRAQPDDVQEMSVLEQVALYSQANELPSRTAR